MTSSSTTRVSMYASTGCAVCYAVLAHLAMALDSVALAVGAVALLAATALIPSLLHGALGAWLALPLVAAACYLLSRADTPLLLLYLPPILGTLFMAWLFGHTLARDRTPLIARIIRLMLPPHTEPDPSVWDYARRLTYAWTLLFVALSVLDILLASIVRPGGLLELAGFRWISPTIGPPTWSLFANALQYVIVAAFFVGEFEYRRRRFPEQPHRNFFEFLRHAITVGPRLLRGDR